MIKHKYIFITFSIFALAAFFVLVGALQSEDERVYVSPEVSDNFDDPFVIEGSDFYMSFAREHNMVTGDSADVIVYCDILDPQCASLWSELKDVVIEKEIGLAWKSFPLPGNEGSLETATALVCASEQGAFIKAADMFVEDKDMNIADLPSLIDIDAVLFESCFNNSESVELIGQDMDDAQKVLVDTFPYIFIGSSRFDASNIDEFWQELDNLKINE